MGTLHQPYLTQGVPWAQHPLSEGKYCPCLLPCVLPFKVLLGKQCQLCTPKKNPEKSLGKQKLNTDVHWAAQLFPPDDHSLSLLFSSLSPTRSSHAADASTSFLSAPQETLQTKRSSAPCVHSLDEGNRVVPIHPNSSTAFMACSEAKELKETCLPPVMNEGEQ